MTEPSIPKKRTTLYIEPNIHKEFKEICDRELGTNMSLKTQQLWARYIAVHGKGNPQLRLEKFIGEVKHACFFCEGHFETLFRVKFISGLVADACKTCLEECKQKTTVEKVLGVV